MVWRSPLWRRTRCSKLSEARRARVIASLPAPARSKASRAIFIPARPGMWVTAAKVSAARMTLESFQVRFLFRLNERANFCGSVALPPMEASTSRRARRRFCRAVAASSWNWAEGARISTPVSRCSCAWSSGAMTSAMVCTVPHISALCNYLQNFPKEISTNILTSLGLSGILVLWPGTGGCVGGRGRAIGFARR